MKPVYLVLLVAMMGLVSVAYSEASEKLLISVSLQTNDNHSPLISGFIKNQKGEPIENATVQISSVLETAETSSDQDGLYVYSLPSMPVENKFSISVKAQKEGYLAGYANTSFFVKGQNQTKTENIPVGTTFKIDSADKIKNDPIALKILQNIELNKQKEAERQKKLQEIQEQQKFLEEQRQIVNENLLNDLQGWFEQFDPFNPRNAFASFASQFDSAVQTIYWGQFNFTESKTNEGLAAFQAVLNSGGTTQDARSAFYEKAAISQSDINKLNNELNAQYAQNDTRSKPDGPKQNND
jgi:hypothetical protein